MSCGVAPRHGLDLALLWLWSGPAAVSLIRPPAWKPPYAADATLKKKKKKKKTEVYFSNSCLGDAEQQAALLHLVNQGLGSFHITALPSLKDFTSVAWSKLSHRHIWSSLLWSSRVWTGVGKGNFDYLDVPG